MTVSWLPGAPPIPGAWTTTAAFPVGDARTWSVTVAKNLTGWGAEWRLGYPLNGTLPNLLPGSYAPPEVLVHKSLAAGTLAVVVNADGSSTLTWTTTELDTETLLPGIYYHQAVVIDPQGNPFTVVDGRVTLTTSLRATDLQPA